MLFLAPRADESCVFRQLKKFLNASGRFVPSVAQFGAGFIFLGKFGCGNNVFFAAGVGYNPISGIGGICCLFGAVSQYRFDNFAALSALSLNTCEFGKVLNNSTLSD